MIRCSSRIRFYLFHLCFSVLEILVFQLRVVFGTAQPEMGSGVVLASILLPAELLPALWRRDSVFIPKQYYLQKVSGRSRTALTWPQPGL